MKFVYEDRFPVRYDCLAWQRLHFEYILSVESCRQSEKNLRLQAGAQLDITKAAIGWPGGACN